MPSCPLYCGKDCKLILAFDIGTTFSGISYSLLVPGQVPEIKGVTRFLVQEHIGGDSKIPSVIFYDCNGEACAIGAKAVQDGILEKVEDKGWSRAEWFKLHMRLPSSSSGHKLPPLPQNKSVIDVFSDFMRYLYNCAKNYIHDTHPNGTSLWASVEQRIEFVLSHPNGWQGAQQAQMRKATVQAKLIPHTNEGHNRVHFITEGEVSLLFCVQHGLTAEAGKGVLIVDAGGGTIDLSAYTALGNSGCSFQEIGATQCHFEGSMFVTRYAREFLGGEAYICFLQPI